MKLLVTVLHLFLRMYLISNLRNYGLFFWKSEKTVFHPELKKQCENADNFFTIYIL